MKRIVICADGTWNKPDQRDRGRRKPSNVVKLARGVLPLARDGTVQVVSYHEGVGTGRGSDRYLGGGTGLGLSDNIIGAYRFLAHNYVPDDRLYFFGFSRGAYTVRSLAGLLDLVGLLPKDHLFFMEEAYRLYRARADLRTDADRRRYAERVGRFRETHACRAVAITLLGVFDTVGALGIPVGIAGSFNRRYRFHHVDLASTVERAFHALAIDETRKPFRPALWQLDAARQPALFEQRWFAGVHTNVGGGYDADGLANVPLHWLKGRASAAGLEFDEPFLAHYRPFHGDELRESFTFRYRLLGRYRRPIGAARNGNETVDASAITRLRERTGGYAPPNLIEFCERTGVAIT